MTKEVPEPLHTVTLWHTLLVDEHMVTVLIQSTTYRTKIGNFKMSTVRNESLKERKKGEMKAFKSPEWTMLKSMKPFIIFLCIK